MNKKKEKKWQEELKGRIKELKKRAEKKPEPERIRAEVSGKPVIIKKNEYAEIKAELETKEKPKITVEIEKENQYAIIKPIVDDIKAKAKEELRERKAEKVEVPKEKVEPSRIELKEIETAIDKMIEILDKRGSVTILDLSRELGVSIEHIESWAKILEDRGLIEMEYPLIGPSRLRKKVWKKES
ncbi:MAG: hypothetical protein QMD36_00035 [Candidatus Aenigmarchaeota archaeon]|nr:hypothetical protein [Candidatus Aenigmarchaeota archaeon]